VQRATPPDNALELFVVAKQWMWKLEHTGGQREIDEMHVPRGTPVKLIMTSEDVIHSFFVPAFRLKQDVLPGRYTQMWFTATEAGRFHLFCAEYCGTDHSRMHGDVVVMEPADFARWLEAHRGASDMAARGEALFRDYGCSGCHSANASVHAPDLAGMYGKPVPLSDGSVVVADERYIRDSILLPAKEVAAGYAPIMPSFAGRIGEGDILDLIAYVRSLARSEERPR
jgi:cytochrome c oxidase subunit 2